MQKGGDNVAKKGGFFRSNWAYLIWFIFYFLFSVAILDSFVKNVWLSFGIGALLYAVSVGFALSPLGEALARFLEGARHIETQEDRDYLIPLFEEVYAEAQAFTPSLNKDIKLYITDDMFANAFALGRKTVAVTRGAVMTFSREELKGLLAHELGHHANGDTKALMIKLVGNGFFTAIILVLRLCVSIIQVISSAMRGRGLGWAMFAFAMAILKISLDLAIFLILFIGDIIIAINSRYSEYLADEYAYQIGYGEELKQSLSILHKLTLPGKMKLSERLKASHPHTLARIARLEKLLYS